MTGEGKELTNTDNGPTEVVIDFVGYDTLTILDFVANAWRLEHEGVSSGLGRHARSWWSDDSVRTGERSSGRQVMSRTIRAYTLEGNLLHLANRATIIIGHTALVDFTDDERRRRDTRVGVRKDDFTAIGDRLGASWWSKV